MIKYIKGKWERIFHWIRTIQHLVTGNKINKWLDCGKYGNWKVDAECDHVNSGDTISLRTFLSSNSVCTLIKTTTKMIITFVKLSRTLFVRLMERL